jgi:peptidoglycan/LPS O-acetylase OafA/YrhL
VTHENTASAPQTTETPTVTRPHAIRTDIQGLRAVAVIAVIVNHVLGWPSGGFAGVDVFFVISGFLITGLLLRDHEQHGKISLAGFYARRVRRIVPAAVTVIVVTAAVGYFLFNRTRGLSTIWDGVYSLLFVANWRFTVVGTDYFHATDPASPLQHYWSLSVEEQFYLVWPWLVIIVLAIAVKLLRSPARARVALGVVMAALVVVSFLYAVQQTASSPAAAYFSTFSRAWELGAGALLAIAAPLLAKLPTSIRFVVGWLGLLALLWSFVQVTDATPFPGPGAALSVGATMLIIAGGIGGRQRYLFVLDNPLSVYLGALSYSLYLWHFPVLIFALLLMPEQTPTVTAIILGLTLAISMIAFYLIEQPFHHSPLLRRAGSREASREAWQQWRDRFGAHAILATVALMVVGVVVGLGSFSVLRDHTPVAAPVAAPVPAENPEVQLQADLAAALTSTAWPDNLSPSIDDALSQTSNNNPARRCFDIGATPNVDDCTWGNRNAPQHMYLVGDSTAMAYAPAFKALAESSGDQWQITTIGLYGCRFTDVLVQNDGDGVMDACPQRKEDVADRIRADAPQLIVMSNAFALGQTPARAPLSTGDLVASTLAEAAEYNAQGRIVYLAPPPLGAPLGQCYSKVSSPIDCAVNVDATWNEFEAAFEATAPANGDHAVSSLPFSCVDGQCPAFAGTLPTKYDQVHMTVQYSEHIAPAIRWAFIAQGLM